MISEHYHPKKSNDDIPQDLSEGFANVKQDHHSAELILGGNFNLLGIEWEDLSVKPGKLG